MLNGYFKKGIFMKKIKLLLVIYFSAFMSLEVVCNNYEVLWNSEFHSEIASLSFDADNSLQINEHMSLRKNIAPSMYHFLFLQEDLL